MVTTSSKSKPAAAKASNTGRTKNSSAPTAVNNTSTYIQWQVIRNNSSFIKRQRGIPKLFSTERFNPKAVNSIRYNGLVNKTAVDVQPSGKGVVVAVKTKGSATHPAKSTKTVTYNNNSRRTLKSLNGLLQGYKPAHSKVARRRTSQILRSLKPVKRAGVRRRGGAATKTDA